MKVAMFIFCFLWFLPLSGWAQQLNNEYETMLLEEEVITEGRAFKPIIGAGVGSFSFYGDVQNAMKTSISGLNSYRISISRNLSRNFDIEFQGTFGEVSVNEYNGSSENIRNFNTSLFFGGVSLYYNFNHLLKRQRPIHPYFSLGAEILQFMPKGDLQNNSNQTYYYWSDGTIRNVAETPGAISSIISRDYTYETDLRKLDLYGYGQYSKTSFALPVDVGVNVTISDRVKCRLGTTFHVTLTDYIDNVVASGGWKNDVVMNTYVALTFDLFSPADEIVAVENFKNLKFTVTDNEDTDGDRVDDFNDECPGTPEGVKVNYKGCPEDTDKDGVPDHLDKQPNTPSGSFAVGANGIKIMDSHLIVLLYDPDAVKRSEVKLYSKTTEAKEQKEIKGIPEKFKQVDINEDNYISHEELQKAIDAIFELNSTLTPSDIYELQEFFFNQ